MRPGRCGPEGRGRAGYGTGRALQPGGVFQTLKRLRNRANVANLHAHRSRHSYAFKALRTGMPERVL